MSSLESLQRAFLDRVLRTGGKDPGPAALDAPEPRLDVYRDMVLGGSHMMLNFVFTETFRILDHEIAATPAADSAADRHAIVRRFLATNPPKTHSTREIADRFLSFFPDAYPDLLRRRPELADLMRIERAELKAHYHVDDAGRGANDDDLAKIRAMSVDEFLAVEILRAGSGSLLALAYPAADVQSAVRRDEIPASPAPAPQRVLVARHPVSLQPVVRAVSEPGGAALALVPSDGASSGGCGPVTTLEAVAADWLPSLGASDAARGEDGAFAQFGEAALAGLASGFLRFAG